ncbi:ATP-grasp superfamily enzyme [Caldisphaera lagunensis DSM 15908]|uniref:ATP-grasp superfamily enzyme n=1 Tax=Caldisphaera lagunensis (strain DSM 15908 / JCM 11604 / ANMR 0165 / IC-154) TaxID=1056495 RepID=L0AD52_CALLD|nr:PAC2 family protein [Caldisphaera lagunensis]AFZ70980.1 ATP-grasp superfamily enzyme [Caldisphaera lagunensis DSM 15908]
MRRKVEIILNVNEEIFKDNVIITGFPGFGRVGYTAPKYLSLALQMKKVGYIMTERMPSVILVEDDGVGLPFEIYQNNNVTVLMNRAIPEIIDQNAFSKSISDWIKNMGFKYVVLIGGLSREFMSENETYWYRWISNTYYNGPKLEAPMMEKGLGVVGPLALLYIYLERLKIPTVMVLPYSIIEGVDYDAAFVGVKAILKNLLNMETAVPELEQLATKQREEIDKIVKMIQAESQKVGTSNIYM